MSFAVLKDAVHTTVAAYTLGSGSLTVAAGTGTQFPVPSTGAPILITVVSAATYGLYPETFATYQATGISTDTLTGLTLISGTDTAWIAGATVEMRTCAKHINDLEAAVAAAGTVTETSHTTSFSAAAGSFHAISGSSDLTATLPTAVGIAGQTVRIRCASGYTGRCTIASTASQTIGPAGATSQIIFVGESALVQSDGANWVRTGGTIIPCRAGLYLSATQTPATASAWINVPLNMVLVDNTGLMTNTTNHSITIPRPGTYKTTGNLAVSLATLLLPQSFGGINKGGIGTQVSVLGFSSWNSTVSVAFVVNIEDTLISAAGDVLTLGAFLGSSSNSLTLPGGVPGASLTCELLVTEVPSW
jgi:hypothetical protein